MQRHCSLHSEPYLSTFAEPRLRNRRHLTPEILQPHPAGPNRQARFPPVILASYDVVVTTYSVVGKEHESSPLGPVFRVRWHRCAYVIDICHAWGRRQSS